MTTTQNSALDKQGYGADLRKYMDLRIDISMKSKERVVGVLKGYDQFLNIVLDNAVEVIEGGEAPKPRELGTILIRGNSINMWQCIDTI
jgi:small nuclear ribonucleoprotein G